MESSCSLEPESDYSWCKQRRIKTRRLPTAAEDLVYNEAGDPECLPLESLPYAVFARADILPVLAYPPALKRASSAARRGRLQADFAFWSN
jgi:hypothetical protein